MVSHRPYLLFRLDYALNPQTAANDHHTSQSDGDDWGWDDAEGDIDPDVEGDWPDPETVSNESSVTLSSKASYKRGYDEVDEDPVQELPSTPGLYLVITSTSAT